MVPPAAAAATAGASPGHGWDIGDANSDSFMVSRTHMTQDSESDPLLKQIQQVIWKNNTPQVYCKSQHFF